MNTKIKILLVEHDANDIELLQYELKNGGINYELEIVQTEKDFVHALESFIPDIILSDYSLPAFDGTTAFIIKEKISPDTPFIFVSGTIGEERAVELIKSGVTDYTLKDKLFTLNPKIIRALKEAEEKKEKRLIEEKLHKTNNLYAFISQVNQNIVRVKNEAELFRNACNLALEFGKFKMAWIGLFDKENQKITLTYQCGIPNEALKLFHRVPYQTNGPQDYILRTNTFYLCNDIAHAAELKNWQPFAAKYGILSCLVLPIQKSGITIGTFNLYSAELNFSGKEELKLLVEVTDDISFALNLFEKEKKHKATEELILKNEKRFRALVENGTDAVVILTPEGKPFYISPTIEKVLGYTEDETMQLELFSMFHPDDIAWAIKIWEQVLANPGTPIPVNASRMIHKDGTWRWLEGTLTNLLQDPSVNGIVDNFRDVTEKIKAEQLLKKSEAFNRGVLNSLKSHIAVVDVLGNIIAVNETWKRFSRENGDATLQSTGVGSNYFNVCSKSAKAGGEIAAEALQGMKDVMKEKINFFSLEYPCHSPDKDRWFEMRVMKFDSDEQLIVVAHTDISELKRAEQELDNTLLQLEHRVETRTKELFDKNKDILDSINYAKRIQVGLLSPYSLLYEIFPKSFILSLPRDIVSGDFFWCYKRHTKKFIVVADCTGHGVPGALMSIIGNNLLNNIIVNEHIENPSEILEQLDMRLKQTIKGDEEEVKDGMDIALCIVDTHFNELYFVGANRPLFISDENGKILELLPDRNTVGGGFMEDVKKFETKRFSIIHGQRMYLSSDGFISQFGGINGKKFMKSRFIKTLEAFQNQPIDQQKSRLQSVLMDWMGNNEQVDDIMVAGIEL